MSSRAILVTGGAGYVGAHACKALHQAGFTPIVLDNLSTGHRSFVRWGPLIPCDIRNADAVRDTLRAYQIEAVLHFAASAYVGESVADPQKYYENNVAGSLALLSAMLDVGCRKIVFSSTCAIYGEPKEIPIVESDAAKSGQPVWRLQSHGRAHPFRLSAGRMRLVPLPFDISMRAAPIRKANLVSCAIRKPISFRGR